MTEESESGSAAGGGPELYIRGEIRPGGTGSGSRLPLVEKGLLTISSPNPFIVEVVTAGAAILLFVGLWTPIAGGLIAVAQLGLAWSHPADSWTFVHLGVSGAAIAMLGPGGCSVDARLFGRKLIQIPPR